MRDGEGQRNIRFDRALEIERVRPRSISCTSTNSAAACGAVSVPVKAALFLTLYRMGPDEQAMSNDELLHHTSHLKAPRVRKRKDDQEIRRPPKDARTASPAVEGRTAGISEQNAAAKTDTTTSSILITTPAENMQSCREKGTSTDIDGHNNVDVCALPVPELMKYAFALGVPTRKKSSNGHRYRRALTDVRADCIAKQRQGLVPPEQHARDMQEASRKKASPSRCGYHLEDQETANADSSLTEERSLSVTQDLSPVFDSPCKSIEAGALRAHKSANNLEHSSDNQVCTKEQASVREKVVPARSRKKKHLAAALGVEIRRGSRTEVMKLAAELGIETRKRDKKNRTVLRGVKEIWKDVIGCVNPCDAIGTGGANQVSSLQEGAGPGTVDRPQVKQTRLFKKTSPDGAKNGDLADGAHGLRSTKKEQPDRLSDLHEGRSHQALVRAADVKLPDDMNEISVPQRANQSVFLDALKEVVSTDRLKHLMQNS